MNNKPYHYTKQEWAKDQYTGRWQATPYHLSEVESGRLPAYYLGRRNTLVYENGTILITEPFHFVVDDEEGRQLLKDLWLQFGDIPMNPETEQIESDFLHFPSGTDKEDIWHWFDERWPGGVYELLYHFHDI